MAARKELRAARLAAGKIQVSCIALALREGVCNTTLGCIHTYLYLYKYPAQRN